MRIVKSNVDLKRISNDTNDNVARIVEFVVRKSMYVGGFTNNNFVEYVDLRHARTEILTDLTRYLSGYDYYIEFWYDENHPNLINYCVKKDNVDVYLFALVGHYGEKLEIVK